MSRSQGQDRESRRIYHLTHTLGRVRTRYGVEMTPEEYDAACHCFRSRAVQGSKSDGMGFTNGWVEVRGTWVLFSYIEALGFIGTALPRPPPCPGDSATQPTGTMRRQAEEFRRQAEAQRRKCEELAEREREVAQREHEVRAWVGRLKSVGLPLPKKGSEEELRRAALEARDSLLRQAEEKVSELEARRAAVANPTADETARDVAWLKARVGDVRSLLKQGQNLAAFLLTDAVCGLPRSLHPSKDLEATEAYLQARAAGETESRLSLFHYMGHEEPAPGRQSTAERGV